MPPVVLPTTTASTPPAEASDAKSVLEFSADELAGWCVARGQPRFRADQVRHWVFARRAVSFAEMHDLPAVFRAELESDLKLFAGRLVRHQTSRDGTEKLLLELHDAQQVECVLMREPDRRTVCISTQAGCAMGCVFCASGLLGLKRNLTTGEILEQVLRLDRLLPADERITNVVVMGIGEPLANLRSLLPALETLGGQHGLGLGARRITISTVGLPERIRELAALERPYRLAVSLHAPNDELRNELVPVNRNIGIQPILEAADEYFARTGRRVTYEYVLLGGVNDAPEHARQLAALLHNRTAHVNLIPMNAVSELPFYAPRSPHARRFAEILEQAGVAATIRKRKGADIDAACGQLRLEHARS
ncbi:MAG: 23S rRNA (adenine(2503)-C(2))-methyltransferase RlmN [Planctomycetes bacterium]|nr:23S rRNA (adenine(2503)-C(2))-methyltransferase RlmN [Planctomycetota bacterium]